MATARLPESNEPCSNPPRSAIGVSKKDYKLREPVLRAALLDAQYPLLEQARSPVLILVNGVDGAGKVRLSTCSTSGWTRATSAPRRLVH